MRKIAYVSIFSLMVLTVLFSGTTVEAVARGGSCVSTSDCDGSLICAEQNKCCDPGTTLNIGDTCYCNTECESGFCSKDNGGFVCSQGFRIPSIIPSADLEDIVKNVVDFLFYLISFLAFVVIIVAVGYFFVGTERTEKDLATLRKAATGAMIGFVIALLSKAIFDLITTLFE
ncbi:MAG: hypothetical protein GF370_02390 [Candidatus Nealsonbacteria bacterium]|nr:hypothetical protein [Candidatus Nealsonbacteria bacterium]